MIDYTNVFYSSVERAVTFIIPGRVRSDLASVCADCVHTFVIIARCEGLSMKKSDSQECHVVFQNNTNNHIPSGYVRERMKGYHIKKEEAFACTEVY